MPISVIIPTYNRRRLVCRAIDSVLSQTLPPAEIIVVDDGSTDGTVAEVQQRYRGQVRVISQPNRGVSAARNLGVLAASYGLLAFLDSDDVWLPQKIELQLPLMKANSVVLSFTDWVYADSSGTRLATVDRRIPDTGVIASPLSLLLSEKRPSIHLGTCMIQQEALRRVGMLDERMSIAEDTRLIHRLAFEGCFASCAHLLYEWNISDDRGDLRLTRTDDDAYLRAHVSAAIEIFMETYARASSRGIPGYARCRRRLSFFLAKEGLMAARTGNLTLARRRGVEALFFGARGRTALRAAAAMLCPRTYSWFAKRRSCVLSRAAVTAYEAAGDSTS